MPKGKSNTGTRKKSNVEDFIRFAKEHQHLNSKQIYELYKKTSEYGIQKQKGLSILRQVFGYDVNEKKGQTLHEKYNEKRAKEYVNPARSKPRYTGKGKTKGANNYITFDKKKGVNYMDTSSPTVQMLKSKIENMFGQTSDMYIEIDLTIADDGYTKDSIFSVWIPFNGRNKQGVKSIGSKIINNLITFYSNLAKRYNSKVQKSEGIINTLEQLQKDLNRGRYLDEESLKVLFESYGITLDTMELVKFTHNERIEGSTRWKRGKR